MGSMRPTLVDAAIAGAFLLLVLAEAALSPDVRSPWMHVLVAGLAMAALAWRRKLPIVVAGAVITANLLVNPEGQFSTLLSLVLVAYTVGAESDPPRSYVGLGVVVLPFLGMLALEDLEPSDVAAALVFLVGPWLLGVASRRRAARVAEAESTARRLEQERERHVAAAAAEERTRIARELHDIVSHSLSVITIQAQAVRHRLQPGQTREAADLEAVESTAREALAEMRRLFGVLRSDGEEAALSPQPGVQQLELLCAQVRDAGLAVEVAVEGEAHPLPAGMDLAAYRIVQEALTNALRHSGAERADVRLSFTGAHLSVSVEDDGRGFDPASVSGEGHGLVGMRERVALYDGTVEIVPRPPRGTRVVAVLPLARHPVAGAG